MGDQAKGTVRSTDEILLNGGCKVANSVHENGNEWHPILPSHGEQKCIICRCKVNSKDFKITFSRLLIISFFLKKFQDSVITCDRQRCARSACSNRLSTRKRLNGLTPSQHQTSSEDCCSAQCRRARRHQNQKRIQREKSDKNQQRTSKS